MLLACKPSCVFAGMAHRLGPAGAAPQKNTRFSPVHRECNLVRKHADLHSVSRTITQACGAGQELQLTSSRWLPSLVRCLQSHWLQAGSANAPTCAGRQHFLSPGELLGEPQFARRWPSCFQNWRRQARRPRRRAPAHARAAAEYAAMAWGVGVVAGWEACACCGNTLAPAVTGFFRPGVAGQ